jgi:uncharacterized protein YlxP (DUF503 family)
VSRRKATIEFTPNPSNPEHQILHKYLSSLDSGISRAIVQAVREKFLLAAMIADSSDRFAVKVAGIELIAKQNAQLEINRGILAAYNLVDSSPALSESSPQVSANISFTSTDEDDDTWDEEIIIPSDDIKFAQDYR